MSEEKDTMRKKFKRKVMVGVGFLLALGGGAFAAILISALMTGTLTTVAKPTLAWDSFMAPQVVSTDGSGITCAPTVSNGKLTVDVQKAMAGSTCTVKHNVSASAEGLKLQGVTMNGLDAVLVEAGGTACGTTLPANTKVPVIMEFTVPQDATVGTKSISGQVDAVPSAQYRAALCNN